MRRLRLISLAWILMAGPACADTIIVNFTGLQQDTENGTYNGFAIGTFNLDRPFADLICDDDYHTTYVPSGPLAYTVSNFGSLVDARFYGIDLGKTLEKYREAAIRRRTGETLTK